MITKDDNKLIQIKKRGKRKKINTYIIILRWPGDLKETKTLRVIRPPNLRRCHNLHGTALC